MQIQNFSKKDRKRIAQKYIKRVRKDISYLLKPRPIFLPFNAWIWVLSKLLFLDNKSLTDICLISSSKTNKIKSDKTA